jgi:hypothetical protein
VRLSHVGAQFIAPISDRDPVTFVPISGCEFIMIASMNVIRRNPSTEHAARTQRARRLSTINL